MRLRTVYTTFVMEANSFIQAIDAQCGIAPVDEPAMALITEAVCKEFGVSVGALLGKGRTGDLVKPRWFAMLLMRQLLGRDDLQIARYFSHERSSVSYARAELTRRLVVPCFDASRFANLKAQLDLKLTEQKKSA